jgi:phenylpropionate dioxygenase-like ring-hydroxylating dioxygenase large terminal subunit
MEDKAASGLLALPTEERSGFIWGTLSPDAPLALDDFLQGLDQLLDILDLASWNVVDQRELPGTNWKLAFDAHLEFYHLPVLHKETFGPDRSNKTLYYFWGPHQRLLQPMRNRKNAPEDADLFVQRDWPEEQWTSDAMMLGEWIIFPNVSLNLFFDGGLGLLISQVIPGSSVGDSVTVQTFLSEKPRSEADQQAALDLCTFLAQIVGGEDLPTSAGQEQVMRSGLLPKLQIGGNEEGIQHQHRWLAALRGAAGEELPALFDYEPGFNGL